MSLKSPVVAGKQFTLPFVDVVAPAIYVEETLAETDVAASDTNETPTGPTPSHQQVAGPVAFLGRFINLGVSVDHRGLRHTAYFSRRPLDHLYSVGEESFKVSGYLSYNYLLSGTVVVGVVFSSEDKRTRCDDIKLSLCASATPSNFQPNFNLEKMGLLLFVADDSSTLVIPNEVDSSLLVRTD